MDRQIQMAEVVQAINKQTRTDKANSINETDRVNCIMHSIVKD